jgi:hypothetical protein
LLLKVHHTHQLAEKSSPGKIDVIEVTLSVNELIHFTKLDLPRPLTIGHEDQNDWFRTCARGRVRPSAWLISARNLLAGSACSSTAGALLGGH